jgi:hypothetical protein
VSTLLFGWQYSHDCRNTVGFTAFEVGIKMVLNRKRSLFLSGIQDQWEERYGVSGLRADV